jgi:hypothetical protein
MSTRDRTGQGARLMNRDLFLDGFTDRIAKRFGLSNDCAFEILSIAAVLDMTFDEVMNDVSTLENGNGKHDGGMDGILIDEDEGVIHVFQVKSGAGLGDNAVSKFVADYRNLFVFDNATQIPLNAKVTKALATYRALALAGRAIETRLYFVFGGELTDQNSAISLRHSDATEQLDLYDRNKLYEQIDSLIAENRRRKPVQFSFMAQKSNISFKSDPQALISFQIQNVKAINFRLAALDLCRLLDKEKEINKRIDSAFSENIRGFLDYNRTNRKIRETLRSDHAEYFPFLNNGITIIAEQVKIPKEMQAGLYPVETRNPVIVNGLQTTHVIYEEYRRNPSVVDGVHVLVRLYETTDPELVAKITDATNTQSPINFRDKMSTKDFNRYVKALFENNGIGYLTKRGDTFENSLSRALDESIHADHLLKFWYASYYEKPDMAKNAKAKVLEDIFEATSTASHPLHALFSGQPDSPLYQQLLHVYRLYTFIVEQRNQPNQPSDLVMYADELFCYGLYKLNMHDMHKAYEKVLTALQDATAQEKDLLASKGLTYSHTSYFKSAKSRYDLDRALGFVEGVGTIPG